jgi:hypothetical protein
LALQLAFDCFVDLPPLFNLNELRDFIFGPLLQCGVVGSSLFRLGLTSFKAGASFVDFLNHGIKVIQFDRCGLDSNCGEHFGSEFVVGFVEVAQQYKTGPS